MRLFLGFITVILIVGCGRDDDAVIMYDRFFNYEGNGVVSLQVDNEVVFILLSKDHTTYNSKILNREAEEYSFSLELASATGSDRLPVHVYGSIDEGVKTLVINNEPVDPSLGSYLRVESKVPSRLNSQEINRWKGLCIEKLKE